MNVESDSALLPIEGAARLIIVDDEAAQMKALCATLRDQGYATTGFTSPAKALAAIREQRFDLLLTDMTMPEMDGVSLLRAALAEDRDLVGIMMTGNGTIDTAVEAMKAGALDYILKPFRINVVLPVLARSLALRRLRIENAELERVVRQRTGELEAVNRELETFSYSVAHDLRSPLRAIHGFSEILLKGQTDRLDGEGKEHLGYIMESTQQMGQTIEDLLALARVSRSEIHRATVDLSALAEIRVDKLRRTDPQRRVEVAIAPGLVAEGDGRLLGLALDNLLNNAWKFTAKRDGAWIEVGSRCEAGGVVFFVRDNGAGFDPARAHKLFGAFQRLHAQSEFAGTGIGLATVQRIVQRHGGRIWAEAKVDAGATFSFTLPSGQEATRPHKRKAAGAPGPNGRPISATPQRSEDSRGPDLLVPAE